MSETSFVGLPASAARACRASSSGSVRPRPKTPAVPRRRKSRRATPSQNLAERLIVCPPRGRSSGTLCVSRPGLRRRVVAQAQLCPSSGRLPWPCSSSSRRSLAMEFRRARLGGLSAPNFFSSCPFATRRSAFSSASSAHVNCVFRPAIYFSVISRWLNSSSCGPSSGRYACTTSHSRNRRIGFPGRRSAAARPPPSAKPAALPGSASAPPGPRPANCSLPRSARRPAPAARRTHTAKCTRRRSQKDSSKTSQPTPSSPTRRYRPIGSTGRR